MEQNEIFKLEIRLGKYKKIFIFNIIFYSL